MAKTTDAFSFAGSGCFKTGFGQIANPLLFPSLIRGSAPGLKLRSKSTFGLKIKKEKLEAKLTKLLEEAYKLSRTNRRKSDEKAAEAEELRKQIGAMH